MLEAGPVLRTWRLAGPPEVGNPVEAAASFDHRLMYLDYEGPISGSRGTVCRWDAGQFCWQEESQDRLVFQLEGTRVYGRAVLERHDPDRWMLVFAPDASEGK
jgi:hypothetical protein